MQARDTTAAGFSQGDADTTITGYQVDDHSLVTITRRKSRRDGGAA